MALHIYFPAAIRTDVTRKVLFHLRGLYELLKPSTTRWVQKGASPPEHIMEASDNEHDSQIFAGICNLVKANRLRSKSLVIN